MTAPAAVTSVRPSTLSAADDEIHARELELPATGPGLHLVAAGRNVGQAERAVLIDPIAGAALLHHHRAAAAGVRRRQHHHAVRRGRAVGHHHLARHAHQPRGDQAEVHAGVFLREGHRHALRFADVGRARIVGGGIAGELTHRIGDFGTAAPQHRADVVLARRKAEQPELSLIVGGVAAVAALRGHHAPRARLVGVAPRRDAGVGHRLAEFIRDAAAEDAAARQGDGDLVDGLRVGQLDRRTGFGRPALTELQRDEPALACRHRVAAGGQLADLESALRVGGGDAAFARVRRHHAHLRAADRARRCRR